MSSKPASLTNIDDWESVSKAHGEVFGEIRPATVILEVSRLIDRAICRNRSRSDRPVTPTQPISLK